MSWEKLIIEENFNSSADSNHSDNSNPTAGVARKRFTPQMLAQEAREVIKLVKSLIEVDREYSALILIPFDLNPIDKN